VCRLVTERGVLVTKKCYECGNASALLVVNALIGIEKMQLAQCLLYPMYKNKKDGLTTITNKPVDQNNKNDCNNNNK
jgi:hypothetical protein